jgi:hypothetical protein
VFNGDDVHASAPAVIPIFIGAASLAQILFWLAMGTAILVGSVLFVKATADAITKAREGAAKNSGKKYFMAERDGRSLFIGKELGLPEAVSRGKMGHDVYTYLRKDAKILARTIRLAKPVGPEVDTSSGKPIAGRFYHFHPYNRSPKMHSFFGYAV